MSICTIVLSGVMMENLSELVTRGYPRVETALLGPKNKDGYKIVRNKYGYNEHGELRNVVFTTIEAVFDEIKRVQACISDA